MIQIEWVEEAQTKTGKSYKKVSTDGKNSIPCWPWKVSMEFYQSIVPGASVDGKIVQDGKFSSLEEATNPNGTVKTGAGNRTNFGNKIEKAMERKDASIAGFQGKKEDSIKISSTFRDATQLAIAEQGGDTREEIQARWLYWRNWLIEQFDVDKRDLSQPF